ncbi:MAG TPA: PQ-loop domain-containing transporter [Nocardioidaceae bacterium]|nr:PQ-loop domain-containing transporter [Nocardioidaceae bacterium]
MCPAVSVVVAVGVAASLVSLYATVPQVLRAARTRSAEGISWDSLLLSLATFTLWVVYAVAVADRIQLVNNTLALCLLGALAVVVVRAGVARNYWSAVLVVFASALASIWLLDVSNSFTLAMVGTTVSSLRMVPQTRLALSRAPLGGLCPWSTLLGWLGMGLWLAYAVMVADWALALCSLIGLTMQSAILAHRLPPRRTLEALAGGRLGRPVAQLAAPVSARFPAQRNYELAA